MKNYIIATLIICVLSISFCSGYLICKKTYNETIKNIEANNKILIKHGIYLQDKIKDLKINLEKEKDYYIEEKYKHPIDKKEVYCINKSDNSSDMRECIYNASEDWEKEINKYLKLLRKSTTPEQYKNIEKSQNLWIQQSEIDHKIINELIWDHGGTLYFDIGASEDKDLIKKRAEFLKTIYLVHSDTY